jgi:hypothetical protein
VNRFLPDTWWEALLRPFAMAFPNGHVYVEIAAPDLRFVLAIALAMMWLAGRRRLGAMPRSAALLSILVAASFAAWMATSGNGRYYVPFLLAVGPLCAALVWHLPGSRAARASGIAAALLLQALLVFDAGPWRNWSLADWRDPPYYAAEVPQDIASTPATFVTVTEVSYSLLYPRFDPRSRWIKLFALSHDPVHSVEARRARELLATSPHIYLLVPTLPGFMTADLQPAPALKTLLDDRLGPYELSLDSASACRLLPSKARTEAPVSRDEQESVSSGARAPKGFWLCSLRFPVQATPARFPPEALAVFARLEQACPRYFPPGTGATMPLADGTRRHYFAEDLRVYVMNDGDVYYKYARSLNAERVGTARDVLAAGFHMDCSRIRGHPGLPWTH